jgi:hypothetical protein
MTSRPVVRPVRQEAVLHDEVGQELVRRVVDRRGVDDACPGTSSGDERIHPCALGVAGSMERALSRAPDAQALRDSPYVEQHASQDDELEALAN